MPGREAGPDPFGRLLPPPCSSIFLLSNWGVKAGKKLAHWPEGPGAQGAQGVQAGNQGALQHE
jgi:hypothetical protein